MTSFTVAVNRRHSGKKADKPQTDFINCTAWRQTAEFITRCFRKASSICVVGTIQVRSWTDTQGAKRYATEVVVDEAMFVDSKNDTGSSGAVTQTAPSYMPDAYTNPSSAPMFEEITDGDDLPF